VWKRLIKTQKHTSVYSSKTYEAHIAAPETMLLQSLVQDPSTSLKAIETDATSSEKNSSRYK